MKLEELVCVALLGGLACSASSGFRDAGPDSDGAAGDSDGSMSTGGGSGGATANGGATGAGGAAGRPPAGGMPAAGGTTGAGGAAGASGTGGGKGTGGAAGASATGGVTGTGGGTGTGGVTATDGASATGGVTGTGGASATGGVTGTGGAPATGGLSGTPAAVGLDVRPANPGCVAPVKGMLPATLKATGCVDASDATKPAPGLIPYDVNSPLWSDGAEKARWLALPDGAKIHVNPDDDWVLPNGTVTMKTFTLMGKRIETRFFVRYADGSWGGYTYEWDDAQTDATLVANGGKTKLVGAQAWLYPSAKQCGECHVNAAGNSLGLETGQLNGDFVYPNGRRANQLATFQHIGLFDVPLPGAPAALLRFPPPSSSEATVESRGKSYIHANCAFCHRQGGPSGDAGWEGRYAVSLALMRVCNVAPKVGGVGVAGARLLTPGMPGLSTLSLRMHALMKDRMPPLATRIVDTAGTAAVDAWITSLSACP